MKSEGPDTLRAQKILRRAMIKVAKDCGLEDDWATFLVINMAVMSATIAEVIGSDRIMTDGGDREIRFALAQFEEMLRQDIAGRIEHERKQTRQ